jgi:hypothetical protein
VGEVRVTISMPSKIHCGASVWETKSKRTRKGVGRGQNALPVSLTGQPIVILFPSFFFFFSVVAVAFQITFRIEIHANDVFLFFKNYF